MKLKKSAKGGSAFGGKYPWVIIVYIIAAAFISLPWLAFGKTAGPGPMTVDGCVSRTGMTEDQCQEMIDKFKNMAPPKDGAKMMPPQNGQGQPPASEVSDERPALGARGNTSPAGANNAEIEKISRLRVEKEHQFNQAESRIAKVIEFLKSKDVDTSEAESAFETFKTKIADVSSAFDAYVQALNNAKTDTSETAATAVRNAKEQIKTAMNGLADSYRTLRTALNDAISKIN